MTVSARDTLVMQPLQAGQFAGDQLVNSSWPAAEQCPIRRKEQRLARMRIKSEKLFDPVRPCLRGIPDCFAVAAAVPAAWCLAATARGQIPFIAALVYGLSVIFMFTISAVYHIIVWPVPTRLALRKVDHSMVYVLIAGSYTPLCLTVLPKVFGAAMLAVVWGICALGILKTFFWDDAPRGISTGIYLAMGWLIVPMIPLVLGKSRPTSSVLLLAGGILYSAGAMVFLRKWPDPYPKHWGHHEIFHLFIIAAVCCHYRAFWIMVNNPSLGTLATAFAIAH